ncbi:mitochondrial carrier domain-containing protein [Lipomyces oligophaga]|uniref:mitochondrial carrier domain-containing protein n=1 Tax=Lipomyces oligophaga TaxID=45792 RepID=UPI0034CE11B1
MVDVTTVAAAVTGGVGAAVVFHPLDTLLVLRQTVNHKSLILPFHHYWRGVTVSAGFSAPAFAVYMVSYRQAKQEFAPYLGNELTYLLSGVIAEITSGVLWTPMEVIKGRMQLKSQPERVSVIKVCKQIYKEEKVRGFFRGYWMSLAMYTPSAMVYWHVYENLKSFFRKKPHLPGRSLSPNPSVSGPLSTVQYAISSSLATIVSEIVSNFLDVIKTRQQLSKTDEIKRMRPTDQTSLLHVARNLIKEAGLVGALFKGMHIRLLYALPTGALSMVIMESIKPDIEDSDDYGL